MRFHIWFLHLIYGQLMDPFSNFFNFDINAYYRAVESQTNQEQEPVSAASSSPRSENAYSMHSLHEALPPQPASPPRVHHTVDRMRSFNRSSEVSSASRNNRSSSSAWEPAEYPRSEPSYYDGGSGEWGAHGESHSHGAPSASWNNWPSSSAWEPAEYPRSEPSCYEGGSGEWGAHGESHSHGVSSASWNNWPSSSTWEPASHSSPEPSTTASKPATGGVAQRLENDPWLWDNDLVNYTRAIAKQLHGPGAEKLNFVNPQLVRLLIEGDHQQQKEVLANLPGPNASPILFLPVHHTNHWSLLVVNRSTNEAFHYDSKVSPDRASGATHGSQFKAASKVAKALGVRTTKGMPIAEQADGHSCGDHVLYGIEVLAHRLASSNDFQVDMDLRGIRPDRDYIVDVLTQNDAAHAAPVSQQPRDKKTTWRKKGWG